MSWQLWAGAVLLIVVPTLVYVGLVWWLDRYEKEPVHLAVIMFAWGALPGALLAVITQSSLDYSPLSSWLAASPPVWPSLLTAVTEEAIKGLALVGLALTQRDEVNGLLDGIIYGALIGLGFGLTENLLVLGAHAGPDSAGIALAISLLRSTVFGLNHPLFTAILGAAIGWGIQQHAGPHGRATLAVVGLAGATMLHAAHNVLAGAHPAGAWSLPLAAAMSWGGVVLVVLLVHVAWREEHQWIVHGLSAELASGMVSASEYRMMASQRARWRAEWQALRMGGWRRYRALSRITHVLTELAFVRYHRLDASQRHRAHQPAHLYQELQQARMALIVPRANDGEQLQGVVLSGVIEPAEPATESRVIRKEYRA